MAAAIATALVMLAAPGRAAAGEFTITACQADGEFASGAFQNFATRDMKWRRACNPLGPGLRGLVTANVARSGHVAVGAQSAFVLSAPPETAISTMRWSGYAHRRDCRYALQLYAVRADGTPVGIKNVSADRHCPRSDKAQASSWPRPRSYDLGGAVRIVQRVVCVGAPAAKFCSARGQNYLQTFTAEATVVDPTPPTVSIVPDGPLARGEWTSGPQMVSYEASDNTGVKAATAWIGGVPQEGSARSCDYAQQIPCPSGPGQIEVQTPRLPEGTQAMHLSAQDAASNGGESAPVTVRIDNTAPGAVPVGVEGGEGWRNRDEFNLVWGNPPEADRAPIVAVQYRVCRVGTQECVSGSRPGAAISRIDGLAVPGPGEWEARIWRADAAGNEQPANASVPVRLRYDPEPPKLGFEANSSSDPTRVSVQVSDPISGLGGGEVEISRVGSGSWQVLPSTIEGGHIVTRIDDAALPAGEYQLRAAARDQAGNLAASEQRLDGQPMRLTLPLRTVTALDAGILRRHKVTKKVRRHGKPHKVEHTVSVLVPQATVDFGQRVQFAGKLLDRAGNPQAGATVEVYSHPPEGAEAQVATLTTGADGGFGYEAKATTSSEMRFAYAGTATTLPAEGRVKLLVPGRSTLKVSKSYILNGQSVVFSGRVQGRPLPPLGKLLELQVWLKEWSTFRTIRSGLDGAWRIPYRFQRTCGLEWFKFKIRLPGEAGYPLESGSSPRVAVRVRGRPCSTG
ncbi:MAG: hypothetical protein AB7V58_00120 [Solirubrobacterales bacterium]